MTIQRGRLIRNFMTAAITGDLRTLKEYLKDERINVDTQDPDDDYTALHHAAENNHLHLVKYLLEQDANTELLNNCDETAFELAEMENHGEIAKLLSKEYLVTCLMEAAEADDLQEVKEILKDERLTIDEANKDQRNWTALHYAAAYGNLEIVKYLIKNGADRTCLTDDEETALDLAKENEENCIVDFLREWTRLGESKLIHEETSDDAKTRIKEIFNFETRERITIIEDLEQHETQTLPITSFDQLPVQALKNIFNKFIELGGEADEKFILRKIHTLSKNRLTTKGYKNG